MCRRDFNFLPPHYPIRNPVENCIADVERMIHTEFAATLRASPLNMAALWYGMRAQ
jgi:hypothetical protein